MSAPVVFDAAAAQPDTAVDVLVVGAGPTGLALAAHLRAYGVQFCLVDRLLDRVHESRALAVQPRTLEVLAGVGVTQQLVERGNRTVQLRMHFQGRVVSAPLFDSGLDDTAYPYLLFVSQAGTEHVLGEHLTAHGVDVRRGVELTELQQTDDLVRCRLRYREGPEEVVHARYVVGCDGAHSTVREQAGIAFRGGTYPQTFVLADVEADGVEPSMAHVFVSARGMLFFFPLGTPTTWRVQAMRPATDRTPVERPVTLDEVQALVDLYSPAPIRLRDPAWMTNFRLHNRGAVQYRTGRVFLAGDAAHVHSPAGAQGMNTGIQDATNLAWKLAYVTAGLADRSLLDTYEPERAPVGRAVLRFTDRAFTVATSTHPLARFARAQLAPRLISLAWHAKPARAAAFRTISQLATRYRRSPLSAQGPRSPRHGPWPGDRLPDAPIIRNGRKTTLHASLAHGWNILLCGPVDARPVDYINPIVERYRSVVTVHRLSKQPGPGVLLDADGKASRRLGVGDDAKPAYLVRPDGHVAYRTGEADLSGLADYLGRWLRVPLLPP